MVIERVKPIANGKIVLGNKDGRKVLTIVPVNTPDELLIEVLNDRLKQEIKKEDSFEIIISGEWKVAKCTVRNRTFMHKFPIDLSDNEVKAKFKLKIREVL